MAETEQWTNRAIFRLLWPLIIEQLLNVTIGVADMLMVSRVGEHAMAGVSLVDAINVLLIITFGALATGGSVVVSQYIGRQDPKNVSRASKQLIYVSTLVSLLLMILTLAFHRQLLGLIYGDIEGEVRESAELYFWLTTLGFPFLSLYNASAALFRSMGNSRVTMLVALMVNILNIGGNALLIFVFHLGVAGAAIATLVSRIAAAAVLMGLLMYRDTGPISLSGLLRERLDPVMIRSILKVGIPSGIENSMFQLGKLMVSRIFTSFGTAAIAANAISSSLGSIVYMPGQGFGMAILTIVGQCIGARNYDGAKRYTAKLMKLLYGTLIAANMLLFISCRPLIGFFGLSHEALGMAVLFTSVHCISSSIAWPLSFALPNSLRAAGDANFCMIVAAISMWSVRVSAAYLLAYPLGVGPLGVWLAMAGDFVVRSICYTWRWVHGRWQTKRVIS